MKTLMFKTDIFFKKGTTLHMLNTPVVYTDKNNYHSIFVDKMHHNNNYKIVLEEYSDVIEDAIGIYNDCIITPAMTIEYHLLKLFTEDAYKKIITLPIYLQEKIVNYTYSDCVKSGNNPTETVINATRNCESLSQAFVFSSTTEGRNFWTNIDYSLKKEKSSILDLVQTGDIIEQITAKGEVYHSIVFIIDDMIAKIGEHNFCKNISHTYGKDLNGNAYNDKIIGIYRLKNVNTGIKNSIFKKESLEKDNNFNCIWKLKNEISKKEIAAKFNIPIEQLKIID